jgi:hypothetical protein
MHIKDSLGDDCNDVLGLYEMLDVDVPRGEHPPKLDIVDTELHLSGASWTCFFF